MASGDTSQLPPVDVYVPAAAPLAASAALRQTTPVASSGCQVGRREESSRGASGAGVPEGRTVGVGADVATGVVATRWARIRT